MYDEVYTRYREVFDTRDTFLRLITAVPTLRSLKNGKVWRVVVIVLMHYRLLALQIWIRVLLLYWWSRLELSF